MKVQAADGLSFAVPVDAVAKIIEHFKKRGYVSIFIYSTAFIITCKYNQLA